MNKQTKLCRIVKPGKTNEKEYLAKSIAVKLITRWLKQAVSDGLFTP